MISESEEGVRFASTTTLVVCCSPTNDPCYSCLQDDMGYLLFLNFLFYNVKLIVIRVINLNALCEMYKAQFN